MDGNDKSLFEPKHLVSLKCVLFLFYGGLGAIYPFLQENMAEKGFAFDEIYSISLIIPIVALLGPIIFALLADKWATKNTFAYGKRIRILTAICLVASAIFYVILMFGVAKTPQPEICNPQVSFLCNRKGAFILQEKCNEDGICHDWNHDKGGSMILSNCGYTCQKSDQFESNCYERVEKLQELAAAQDNEDDEDVKDEGDEETTAGSLDTDGDGIPDVVDDDDDNDGIPDEEDEDDDGDGIPDAEETDSDGDGIPDLHDDDDDNDGIPDAEDDDDDGDGILDVDEVDSDGDGIPDAVDDDDDNDGIPDSKDNDDDGDGIPDAEEVDSDGDGIPDVKDDDDDNDGIPDTQDTDDDGDGIPDTDEVDTDGDGIPDVKDDDDDNDGIPDSQDTDDDGDGIPDVEEVDSDGDGIPDVKDDDDDNDGIPDTEDDDDDGDGIPDAEETDTDGDGTPDSKDDDDDNDGIPDSKDTDDDGDGIPDLEEVDSDGDGIPDVKDDDDDNDGIPDAIDEDDDGDGIPDEEEKDTDGDGIPDIKDNDDDNDGIPDSKDDDDDGDGIPDAEELDTDGDGIPDVTDEDDDGDGIPDAEDDDDDGDGILDVDEKEVGADEVDEEEGTTPAIVASTSDDDEDEEEEDKPAEATEAEEEEEEVIAVTVKYDDIKICMDPDLDDNDNNGDEPPECKKFDSQSLEFHATFDEHNEKDDGEECLYPLDGFECPIDYDWVKSQPIGCKPVVECEIENPYGSNTSLLAGTTCDGDEDNDGDDDAGDVTYYYYLSIRSCLDIFLLASLTLLNAMIVIAVRDPHTGVGDFGRQLVWGAIGWIIFFNDDIEQPYYVMLGLYTIAVVILLSPIGMPITPAEEWWQFKGKAERFFSPPAFAKYFKKSWLLFIVTILLGTLWSIIDSIEDSHMKDIPQDEHDDDDGDGIIEDDDKVSYHPVWRTLLLIGDLLAIPMLVFSKRIIETFGTFKIFVGIFFTIVIRYLMLGVCPYEYWDIIEDMLLPTTLGLTWITIVYYFKDNFPHKCTAIAQALPIIAHFCLGRFFGALFGVEYDYDNLENDYEIIAVILIIFTIISIIVYRWRDVICDFLKKYIPACLKSNSEDVAETKMHETDV